MQSITPLIFTTTAKPQIQSQTRKDTKLIAIWEIESQDSNNRKLICRWVQV